MGSDSLSLSEQYQPESVPLELFTHADQGSVNAPGWAAPCLFPVVKWGIMDATILVPALSGMNQ